MENRKGNGIFLGIVSIATLIVAIIGATFAFFSATTESAPNAVNLEAYEYSLSMSVNPVWAIKSGIIPMNPTGKVLNEDGQQIAGPNNTNLLYAINEAESKCVDNVNNLQVCVLYEVTVNNNASNPIQLAGKIKTTANNPGSEENSTGFQHLTYQEVIGTPTTGFELGTKNVTLAKDVATEENSEVGIVDIAGISVPGATDEDTPGVGKAYVLIYLHDDGVTDQSYEMGSSYEGQIIYSSEGEGGSTLTGSFKISGTNSD